MRVNPFYDAWQFLTGNTGEHVGSGIGLFLTLLFLALIVASIAFAWKNWRDDPAQRTASHLAIWFMRFFIGTMWFQGSVWKLPLPVSGGFVSAVKPIEQYAAFEFHRWIATNIFIPLVAVINPVVFFTEFFMGIAFIIGFLVRPMAVMGILFVLQLYLGLYRQSEEWPWLYVFLMFVQGFFVVTNAGKSLGLDAMVARRPFGPFAGNGLLAQVYRKIA